MTAFDKALAELLAPTMEGGLVDNPADPGGRTNLGITQRTLDGCRSTIPGLPATVDELTPATAALIYRPMFWDAVRGDELPEAIASCLFKQAVNQGVPRAIIELQDSLGLALDGHLGPVTLSAAARKDPVAAVTDFEAAAIMNYVKSSNWTNFGRGWVRRAVRTSVEAFA
jgi:lysozyme family protein